MDAFAAKVDVTSRTQVENAVGETVDRYGRLDILVNNAGITSDALLYKMTDEDWRSVLNVHLSGRSSAPAPPRGTWSSATTAGSST